MSCLDTESAALIVHVALTDEDPMIVAMAEKELDSRWSDAVWD